MTKKEPKLDQVVTVMGSLSAWGVADPVLLIIDTNGVVASVCDGLF